MQTRQPGPPRSEPAIRHQDAVSIHRQQDPRTKNRARQVSPTTRADQHPDARKTLSSIYYASAGVLRTVTWAGCLPGYESITAHDPWFCKAPPLRTTTPEQARGKTKLHPLTSCTRPARLPQKGKQMMMMPAPFVIACRPTRHQPYFLHQCRLANHPHLDCLLNKELS